MKIVLAGCTGFIGGSLTESLASDGHEIISLTRDPGKYDGFKNVTYIKWDARAAGDWTKHINGADAVVNLAGEPLAEKRWTRYQKEWILNSRVESTKAIVQAIAATGSKPATLINASAVGYYGNVKTGEVDESHERGEGFLADVCLQWENEASKVVEFGTRLVILRTGVVLEKDGGALKSMLSAFNSYAGGTPGSGKQWVPWIHREDVISAIKYTLANASLEGAINLSSPNPVTMKELATTIGRVIKKPMWAQVPSLVVKAALGEMADMLLTGQKAIPRKLTRVGFEFKFPQLAGALKDILL